ncbi:hypothetical protein Mal4_36620 [Maioricimonas rarisocia]|uniref:Uncharacterized protein n=1 Tax=Maioricimonas rarisocia TaxID=2528026 RepID=A0A517ZA17_9PLAN|nr:hypothetical protein [Maioricimonas rarisocia]QDU39323.1 hypothetical protein Mal4_36620 [Maioricimonas rarisocia]
MPHRASRYLSLVLTTAALLALPTSSAEACWWGWGWGGGYGAYYAPQPVTYGYAGYATGYRGYYAGYAGYSSPCGPGGCGVTSYYAGSSCGTCGPCGLSSCGYGCGYGCNVCGDGNCPGGDCGVNYAPADGEPIPDDNVSGSGSDVPRTYSDEPEEDRLPPQPADDDFEAPIRGREGSSIPDGDSSAPESRPDSSIPRGGLSIPMNDGSADPFPERNPAGAEPGADESINFEPEVEPLEIEGPLTLRVSPARSRVSVKARYRLPNVARLKVEPDADGWIPVADDADAEAAKVASN